jgi:hypothetical protein
LLLVLAPAAGLVPAHRDLVDFFAPMRAATAASLAAGEVPWLNLANGCGEAWFGNPETAVLYPPAWLHLVLPPAWALTLEIALHLAWLSLGVGLVARKLGAGPTGRLVAEAAAWSAGPVLFTVGVLNNLETLAWVPWMVLAARTSRGIVFLVAVATALAWLGGEPQIWALAVVLTLAVARSRWRVAAGLALGALVVAVQMVPFAIWVLEGDRGPKAASWALRGALHPLDWSGVLVPGLPVGLDRMVYVESLFLGPVLVLCALLGARRSRWLLAAAAALGLLATLPELGGSRLLLALTGGLVRYPSRFALLGLALLLPLVGRGAEDWLAGRGRWLAAGVAALAIGFCALGSHPWAWVVAGLPAALMLWGAVAPARRIVRAAALALGLLGVVAAGVPLLGLQSAAAVAGGVGAWSEAADGGRLYAPAPSDETVRWLATGLEPRRLWPVGYLNLSDGLTLVRTDAPVANRRLVRHLETADLGPPNRWWLDTLAARWVVLRESAPVPSEMDEVSAGDGMRLLRNRAALPEVLLASGPPVEDRYPQRAGDVSSLRLSGNTCSAVLETPAEAWLWVSIAPVRGWRWSIDGAEVELQQGPGILQALPVAAGRHELVGRYRPPGLIPLATISALAALATAIGLWRGRRRPTVSAAAPDEAASPDPGRETAGA